MQPARLTHTFNLTMNLGLSKYMTILAPPGASEAQLLEFHSPDYINFVRTHIPSDSTDLHPTTEMKRFGFKSSADMPAFDSMYQFSQSSAGASIACAEQLNANACDIAMNYAGGMHHSHKDKAGGFCVANDCVLACQKLLKCHRRVLYLDIDCHHSDGVQAAFCNTDRVMTVSFHKFGKRKNGQTFFPGTGRCTEVGTENAKYYTVNVPLKDGIDDDAYARVFNPIVDQVFASFNPEAVVMQTGADSLGGDLLGLFNLTTKGHARCVKNIKERRVPLILLGGGGYSIPNVARCWTNETAVALGKELEDDVPLHSHWMQYAGENFKLHTKKIDVIEDENSRDFLEEVTKMVLENLKQIKGPPSVQIGSEVPETPMEH